MTRFLQAVLLLALAAFPVAGAPAGREQEPVVLTGADLPGLAGRTPGDLVGFRRSGSAWVQVPVQVDEKAMVDLYTVVNQPAGGVVLLTYTDAGTFTGSDPDPAFDADDELVFLAGSAGDPAGAAADPAGVTAGIRQEVRLTDPVSGDRGYLYLFASAGALDPAAGAPAVDYRFQLVSGDYRTTYNTGNGTNPETSSVTTPAYTVRFSDRWVRDGMELHAGGGSGVDILDRHRSQFTPTNCSRTEDTFSNGAGAFIVNRTGPVRALRGYLGANSGPTTYRIHAFYREREVVLTALRVHQIVGVMDFLDLSPAAAGMSYRNNLAPAGVLVDGIPDSVPEGSLSWEMLTGSQGTLAQVHRFILEQPDLVPSSYYEDQAAPLNEPCAGDGSEYGAAGPRVRGPILNTDPELDQQAGEVYRFELIRTLAYGPPGLTNVFAQDLAEEVAFPLEVTVNPSVALCPDLDNDGFAICDAVCELPAGTECGDCDDGSDAISPGADEACNGVDDDCDGSVDEGVTTTYYHDGDGDGYGDPARSAEQCSPPEGYVANPDDCDDGSAAVSPGALEACNGVDDDCDGMADEGVEAIFYRDADDDGYGNAGDTTLACLRPTGYAANPDDCNDADAAVHPGSTEQCGNGLDDDCNGLVDAADPRCPVLEACPEADGDGYAVCDGQCFAPAGTECGDCNDATAGVYPGATEICNGIDDDCNGMVDETATSTWNRDADADGYGHPGETVVACSQPAGFVADGGDCNDGDASVNPGATEICNGIDDDCNAQVDEDLLQVFYRDFDGDGYGDPDNRTTGCSPSPGFGTDSGDCDDSDAAVNPGAVEVCDNGFDDDCDGLVDAADDLEVPELCNGLDDDCSGLADDPACNTFDLNGDGRIDAVELSWLGRSFGLCQAGPPAPWWQPVDYDGSGCIDGDDLVILANLWGLECLDGVLVCP